MKKILPILTVIGCSALFVGCDSMLSNSKTRDYSNNLRDFKESINKYNQTKPENIVKTVGNYNLSIVDSENDVTSLQENIIDNNQSEGLDTTDIKEEDLINETPIEETPVEIDEEFSYIENSPNEDDIKEEDSIYENNKMMPEISTLYSITNDIENGCDEFCELKTSILNAIAESEKLSEKLKNNELNLTREQRLFINEQSNQLKNLSRQLTNATNELSFNLSDLTAIMKENNQDIDALSIKYLIVLDNLINGNEMLKNGLSSLNLINNMMQINSRNLPSNNTGKILYGFQQNGNPPVYKEYSINDSGELEGKIIENTNHNDENSTNLTESDNTDEKTSNVYTYQNSKLASNIDTYGNTRKNIDSFFNTALFDNDFMYGTNAFANNGMYGNGYGYGGMFNNPNVYQYANYEQQNEQNNSTNGINNINNTHNTDKVDTNNKAKKKKFKLKSNIDTYKDENTPNIKTKISNFKSSIANFFNRANINPSNDIITPIHKLDL